MSTDTIDMSPLINRAVRAERNRPTRPVMWSGIAVLAVAGLPAIWLAISTDPTHVRLRESYNPILLTVAVLGGIFVAIAVSTRILQYTRAREGEKQREKIKRDMTELLTAAKIDDVRRAHSLRDQTEERLDEIARAQAETRVELVHLREAVNLWRTQEGTQRQDYANGYTDALADAADGTVRALPVRRKKDDHS